MCSKPAQTCSVDEHRGKMVPIIEICQISKCRQSLVWYVRTYKRCKKIVYQVLAPPIKRGPAMAVARPKRTRSAPTLLSTLPLLIPSHWQHQQSWNQPVQWSCSNHQGLPLRLQWLHSSQVESPTQRRFPLDWAPSQELLLALDRIPPKWSRNSSKNSRFVQLCRH